MFCEKCGKEIPDSTKFCPYCGAPVSKAQDFVNKAGEAFNAAEQELGSAFDEVKQSFTGNSANQQNAGGQYNGGYQNNGIGPFIAMHILIKNSNMICNAYNRTHGLM